MKLGVNIDHVATLREARRTFEPDPVKAAIISEEAGADGIVCHLRKDRRHIQYADVDKIRSRVSTRLNLEMSVDPEIVDIACLILPDQATLVPENRQEITTEGGLDVAANIDRITDVVGLLVSRGIQVNLFIDPEERQVEAALAAGAAFVEFHTGAYAEKFNSGEDYAKELEIIRGMAEYASGKGLIPCAGHGLTYDNVGNIAEIQGIYELNIGHSIISRAVFTGIAQAVKEMKEIIS